ncbi:leucine-rich repeat domain-containing protein [Nocardioides sp. AE5]|uniref:leucine-rich repeat domain-containing protein n=1 Tax=Nocardioides sp. AE5 TaxID=2962573 RepID=UPI002881D81C|nr:leucine-rich repeat domain-containing protein [Nocardioides sp. AE5]MDT0200481.1 leucine-rich repeat domain-containing protein [Nocardioides sp. AE5]
MAASALMLGSGLAMALPATAGPADPITMPDDNLRACINADLGQGASDPITEAQAAGITEVDCPTMGITDITGLETMSNLTEVRLFNNSVSDISPLSGLADLAVLYLISNSVTDISPLSGLTGLTVLYLNSNSVTDISPLSGLTDLTSLYLTNNSITDISVLSGLQNLNFLLVGNNNIADLSPVAGLSNLRYLHAEANVITDISVLSSLTSLTNLWLQNNGITNISPLAGMTNLTNLRVEDQSASVPTTELGATTTNPVADVAGDAVPVTSTDSGFSYDSATNAWTFAARGNKSLAWSTSVAIGTVTDATFSGTISQRISFAQAVPEDPAVVQTTCMNGDVVYPQITLPDTEGITYTIVGDVAPGETVTIEAVPADDDHAIYVDPASDWVDASGDHIYATLEITLDDPDCDAPAPRVIDAPNGDLPVDDPCGPDNATWVLPTGADVPVGFTWKVNADGLLTAEANDGYVFSDPSGNLDPMLREYGYAPDTNQACPASSGADGDDSDQIETTGHTLPNTGGPGATAGILGVALLGIGGLMVLTGRTRRQRA